VGTKVLTLTVLCVGIIIIQWDSGVLIKMGWSASEDLLCIQEDGNVLIYDIFGLAKETVKCLIGSVSLVA
jgi:hypothetical protein